MEVAEPGNYLEILDLKLKWENGKIMVDVHSKPTNSFTYILPTTCYIPGKVSTALHIAKRKKVTKVKFITIFNIASPSIEGLIRKHIHYLHSDEVLKKVFPNNKFSVIYERKKKLKEVVSPSL